jgi:hypothetical protein
VEEEDPRTVDVDGMELHFEGIGEEQHTGLPPRAESWRRRSAMGAILSGIAFGLKEALEPERDEPAIVVQVSGDPIGDRPVEASLDDRAPKDSVVTIRPWLLPDGSPETAALAAPVGAIPAWASRAASLSAASVSPAAPASSAAVPPVVPLPPLGPPPADGPDPLPALPDGAPTAVPTPSPTAAPAWPDAGPPEPPRPLWTDTRPPTALSRRAPAAASSSPSTSGETWPVGVPRRRIAPPRPADVEVGQPDEATPDQELGDPLAETRPAWVPRALRNR